MVRALLYECFLSFHLDLLKFSLLPRLPFFCAKFPEDVQTWQAWSYYSAVFCVAAGEAAGCPVAFFSGVCTALRCPAKICDTGFVLGVSSYRNGL